MPIRDVASGVTGGIGPIRYVENGVTVNISTAYVVENGVTALVYKEEDEDRIYTPPSQDLYYLYNRGVMSDVLGGFTKEEGTTFTYKEEAGYLALTCPKSVVMKGRIFSKHIMDLTAYNWVMVEYEYISENTGTLPTGLSDIYAVMAKNTDGSQGYFNTFGLYAKPTGVNVLTGMWEDTYITFEPATGMEMSSTEDITFRIYSIYITKQ